MAITAIELQPAKRGFIVNAVSNDASTPGGETLLAAVAGQSHHITSITMVCITAITLSINPFGIDNILGPVPFAATSAPLTVIYSDPVKVDENKSLLVKTSGAGAICVVIQGYTE